MNTTVLVAAAAAIAVVGRWSQGKDLNGWKMGGGLLLLIILLVMFDYFAHDVALPLAGLVFIASLITYGGPLLEKLTTNGLGRGGESPTRAGSGL